MAWPLAGFGSVINNGLLLIECVKIWDWNKKQNKKEPRGTSYIGNTGIWYELLISSWNQSWSYSLNYKRCADSGREKVHSYFSYLYKLGTSVLGTSSAIQLVMDFNVLWTALV